MSVEGRVLVIDDQANLLNMIAEMFEVIGLEFLGATDGRAGIEMAREHQPDLIVCDYYMEGLNGLQVFERLRKNESTAEIPFVLMTMDDSLEASAREAGVDGFISKGTTDLVTAILELLPDGST